MRPIRSLSILLALTAAASVGSTPAFADQEVPAPVLAPNGHLYQVFSEGKTFAAARAAATTLEACGQKGHLASVSSDDENMFVRSLARTGLLWLGGFEADEVYNVRESMAKAADGWEWVDTDEPWGYTNWNSMEPNDFPPGNENAVEMYENGKWNDIPGTMTHAYVVEFDCTELPGFEARAAACQTLASVDPELAKQACALGSPGNSPTRDLLAPAEPLPWEFYWTCVQASQQLPPEVGPQAQTVRSACATVASYSSFAIYVLRNPTIPSLPYVPVPQVPTVPVPPVPQLP